VAFKLVNALEQGDYCAGFAPDCAAADALEFERGDPREASLAEALHFVEAGACSAGASGVARVARPRFQAPRPGGWQQLLGAQ
jgi:hypothetical protein